MGRVVLVRPGPGAPEMLSLEAWQALARGTPLVAPGDLLGERLRAAGIEVEELPEAEASLLRPSGQEQPSRPTAPRPAAPRAHRHAVIAPGARALAERLAALAAERGEVAFILPRRPGGDDPVTGAVVARAMAGDVEVEIVVGTAPRGHLLLDLVRVMARLRGPDGCPWDHEQTHRSLAAHLLEETYELLEAVESAGPSEIAEELGDLLLQVIFHSQIGFDEGTFDVDDVVDGIVRKLVGRHPHVFGDVEVSGTEQVVENWDAIKQAEKGRESALEGIPESLPALAYAQKLLRRAGPAPVDLAGRLSEVAARIEAAAARDAAQGTAARDAARDITEDAVAGALLAIAALAGRAGLDAEGVLRRAARGFRDRLARAEQEARARGRTLGDLSEEERARLWGA
ncbi:MAG: nucleoside triphosphate pyrophosphohydrolase [Acidobacteria bacterium]|nr:nucleoside triphosphate pyrophosphohydrolase [Acidobacteriota bacterium]